MTIPKSYECGGLAKKSTEKLASCLGMFSVQKVCSNKQGAIIPIHTECRFLFGFRILYIVVLYSSIRVLFRD